MPKRITQEEFIKRCKDLYGEKFDFSKTIYKGSNEKVCVICAKHGEFMVRAADFLRGHNCSMCYGNKKSTTEDFKEKAKKKHKNKYDYSKVNYKNRRTKVTIICHKKDKFGKEHGEFEQTPGDHLFGYGCPKCGNEYKPTNEEWIERANIIHNNFYDYSKTFYEKANKKVCIICPEHGEFWQTPSNHINGCNCPECNSNEKSKMEEKINYLLKERGYAFERQKTFDWLKLKRNLFLDFFLNDFNIAVEVQGDQHYVPIEKFGGIPFFKLQQKRDKVKHELCLEHNIKVFYITKKDFNIDEINKYIDNIKNNGTAN